MTTARNAGRINVWPSTVIARAADTAESKVLGRMTVWPTHSEALQNREYPDVEEGGYVGPLDIYSTGIVGAYSLSRALSAAKRGSAVLTIREDGGDTTQSFNSDATTGLVSSAAIVLFLDSANGFVTLLDDQSGNSSNLAQATAAAQPQWLDAQLNTRPALAFDNTSTQRLITSGDVALSAPGEFTIFVVSKPIIGGVHSCIWAGVNGANVEDANGNDFSVGILKSPTKAVYAFADNDGYTGGVGISQDSSSVGIDDYSLIEVVFGPSNHGINFNGADTAVSNDNYDDATSGPFAFPLALGAEDAAGTFLDDAVPFFEGQILEFILYSSILSAPDRLAIRQNIAAYYGITLP